MGRTFLKIADSSAVQFTINIILYTLYAAVMGVSLIPSVAAAVWGADRFLASSGPGLAAGIPLFSLCLGAAFFLYLMWGSIFMAIMIRLLSIGIRPGTYPAVSITCLRWILYSGIATMAMRTILPITVMSFFCKTYYRIIGCRIGKNVYINSPHLNDVQFMELGDNVVIGGMADVTCHTFEGGMLILGRISIGAGTVIGANSYIFPNVTIGRRCSIGVNTIIRKNRIIPDGSIFGTPGGIPARSLIKMERESASFMKRRRPALPQVRHAGQK